MASKGPKAPRTPKSIALSENPSSTYIDKRGYLRRVRPTARLGAEEKEVGERIASIARHVDAVLHNHSEHTNDPYIKDMLQDHRMLIRLTHTLNGNEYRILVSLLGKSMSRKADGVASLRAKLLPIANSTDVEMRALRPVASKIVEIINNTPPDSLRDEPNYISNLRILIRAGQPYGINILNPACLPNEINSLPADKPIYLHIGDALHLQIKTDESGHTCIHVLRRDESDKQLYEVAKHNLSNADYAIVGRRLLIRQIADIMLATAAEVFVRIESESMNVSRGALMIVKQDNKIFFYDRGSHNPVKIQTLEVKATYMPEDSPSDDGYGHTVLGFEGFSIDDVPEAMLLDEGFMRFARAHFGIPSLIMPEKEPGSDEKN